MEITDTGYGSRVHFSTGILTQHTQGYYEKESNTLVVVYRKHLAKMVKYIQLVCDTKEIILDLKNAS